MYVWGCNKWRDSSWWAAPTRHCTDSRQKHTPSLSVKRGLFACLGTSACGLGFRPVTLTGTYRSARQGWLQVGTIFVRSLPHSSPVSPRELVHGATTFAAAAQVTLLGHLSLVASSARTDMSHRTVTKTLSLTGYPHSQHSMRQQPERKK